MDNYFVTCIDAGRVWYMAGPYKTHEEALAKVDAAREIGIKNNPWASFYEWGTCLTERTKPGNITAAGLL